jgi:hypothetical protein
MSMPEPLQIEELLAGVGRHAEWPPTPDLATAVRRRLERAGEAGAERRWTLPSWRLSPRLAMGFALVLIVVGGTLLAAPPVRNGIARFLHLPGVDVQRAPHPLPSATGGKPGAERLGLGAPVTLAEARARARFPVRVPGSLGPPDQVYVLAVRGDVAVSLVYLPRPGLPEARAAHVGAIITQVPGLVQGNYMKKVAGPDTIVAETSVGGHPAFWLTGAPHAVGVENGDLLSPEPLRLAGDTLVWSDGSVATRIESALDLPAVLTVAAALR